MPVALASASAFSVNGKGYVLGGRDQGGTYQHTLYEYNPTTDAWTQLSLPNEFRARICAVTCVVNDTVYLGLGHSKSDYVYNDTAYLRDFWQWIPASNTWKRLPNYIDDHTHGCAAFQEHNKLIIGAGFNAFCSTFFYDFDLSTHTWSKHLYGGWPGEETFAHVSGQVGNRCFIGTGFNPHSWNIWFEYVPAEGKYYPRQKLPTKGRDCATSTSSEQYIYVIGGQYFGGDITRLSFYDDILRYNPNTDSWTYCGQLPCGGTMKMCAFTIGNRIYFGGGEHKDRTLNNQFYYIEE